MDTGIPAAFGGVPVRSTPLPNISDASGRIVGSAELANLTEVITTGRMFRVGGKFVTQFEQDFSALIGRKHGIACTSGTAAVHIAVATINPDPGDEIITAPITDMGTIAPILMQNAIPIFADLDPKTYTMLPESIEANITSKTKAIIVVHLFGQPADMDPILEIGRKYEIPVIEDCAQAYLTEYKGRLAGTMGDIGCFSLQQSKHMTSGDGGIVVTNNDAYAERARLFADKGWPRGGEVRDYLFLGINYRMNELAGAVACAQTGKVAEVVEKRRKVAEEITKRLKAIEGINVPVVREGCKHSWWLYPITIDESVLKCTPKEFATTLSQESAGGAHGYIGVPIYMSRMLQEKITYGSSHCPFSCPNGRNVEYKPEDCPNTLEILRTIINMPCNELYTEQDISDIVEAIGKTARYYRSR